MPPEPLSGQSTNDTAQQQSPKAMNDGTDREVTVSPAEPKSLKTDDYTPPSSKQTGDMEEVEVSVDASKNLDYNFPQDEPVPEDLPEVEEKMLAKSVALMHTGSKKKSQRIIENDSILYVIVYTVSPA